MNKLNMPKSFLFLFPLFRYEEYLHTKATFDSDQPPNTQFIESRTQKYSCNHPQQRAITQSILSDLIINCNMPLSIIEHESFLHFLSIIDNKYSPVSRRTITSKLDDLVAERQLKLKNDLAKADNVSVTVDIWSDRRMRGFLGVTAHWLSTENLSLQLKSQLLACNRFKGSHTGERICEEFEQICEEYQIRRKVEHIICDNAANMKKAFSTCFPGQGDGEDDLDDSDIWNDLIVEEQEMVEKSFSTKSQTRLQCFAHTLQLVIGDGLKETK